MLRYDQLKRSRWKFLAVTGLTPKEFQELAPAFERAYERAYPAYKTLAGKPRRRRAGGGRKGSLDSLEQKLLFVLVYQKMYPVQAALGEVFDLSQARVNDWIHRLLPVLQDALDDWGVLPKRDPRRVTRHGKRLHESLDLLRPPRAITHKGESG